MSSEDEIIDELMKQNREFQLTIEEAEVGNVLLNFRIVASEVLDNRTEDNLTKLDEQYKNLIDILDNKYFIIEYNIDDIRAHFRLDSETITDLYTKVSTNNLEFDIFTETVSGASINYFVSEFNELDIPTEEMNIIDITNKVNTKRGLYFKYSHDTSIDLHQLQIISTKDNKETFNKVNKEHCFIYSLIQCVNQDNSDKIYNLIHQIRLKINSGFLRLDRRTKVGKKLNEIIEDSDIKLSVSSYDFSLTKKPKVLTYGNKKSTTKIQMILFREHFMANIKIIVNKREDLFNLDRITYKQPICILRKLLKTNRYFPNKFNVNRNIEVTVDDMINIDIENDQEDILTWPTRNKSNTDYYFADFESIVYKTKKHLPYMLGVVSNNMNFKSFTANNILNIYECNIFTKMLKYIVENGDNEDYIYDASKKEIYKNENKTYQTRTIYFHNLKYDFTLIKACPYISIKNELNKLGSIYSVDIEYNYQNIRRKFKLVDSYKMINSPLSKFQEMFNLNIGKMSFDYYNIIDLNNYNNLIFTKDEFTDLLKTRENLNDDQINDIYNLDIFKKNTTNLGINFKNIYKKYLQLDCTTLQQGMNAFSDHIEKIFGIYALDSLTVSSLAYKYMKLEGCLNDTSLVSNNLQEYIMKAVSGGRVCLLNNEKQDITKKIADFDGVSLYPSAILRTTIPCGDAETIPKILLNSKDLTKFDIYSQYIVTVKLEINKNQQIPFTSNKVNLVRNWTNNIDDYITIDKTTLEDLINFQDATIIHIKYGIGWPLSNGVNNNLQKVIQYIFDERLKAKQEGNSGRSNAIKLIMNSIYGKTMLRDSSNQIKYIRSKEKFEKYIFNNYDLFDKATEISKQSTPDDLKVYRINMKKAFVGNSNSAHIGCFILSMSKRIMNEVLDIANTNNLPIYYTDTDSIHIQYDHVKKLADKFKLKYNRNLVGKNLGQFHIDFESKVLDDSIHSKRFIGVGKKCYLDILTDNNNLVEEYHIRFKGASKENILEYCKSENINVVQFYELLHQGNPIQLDLCSGKVRFIFNNKSVSTAKQLLKTFKF